jgi:hypothetical protein
VSSPANIAHDIYFVRIAFVFAARACRKMGGEEKVIFHVRKGQGHVGQGHGTKGPPHHRASAWKDQNCE